MRHVDWIASPDFDATIYGQIYGVRSRSARCVETIDVEAVVRVWVTVGVESEIDDENGVDGEHDACDYDTYSLASGSSRQLLNDRLEEGQF